MTEKPPVEVDLMSAPGLEHSLKKMPGRKNSCEIVSPTSGEAVEEEVISSENPNEEEVTRDNRQGLLSILTRAIGVELTAISLPVTLNEPTSFLMRIVEQCQYSELLDKAAFVEDSLLRLMYVATWAISVLSCTERTAKPFNPVLGETFEYVDDERQGFKMMCEQVSHHPPVSAGFADTDNYTATMFKLIKSKFGGNSLEFVPPGKNRVFLKSTGEEFEWSDMKCSVHNVIVGTVWVDHFGEIEIINKKTKEKAKLEFKRCGWFSKNWHEVEGMIYDAQDRPCIGIFGKWNEAVYAKPTKNYTEKPESIPEVLPETPPKTKKEAKKEKKKEKREQRKSAKQFKKEVRKKLTEDEPLWTHTSKPLEPEKLTKFEIGFSKHTLQLLEITDFLRATLPSGDSRFRMDRICLEKNDTKQAAIEKNIVEEKQRELRRQREANKQEWVPKYFKKVTDAQGEFWEYIGGYWEEREQRVKQFQEHSTK